MLIQFVEVMLGGGRSYFQPNTTTDPEDPTRNNRRQDGRDLIAEWKNARRNSNALYVWNKNQLHAADPATTDALLGTVRDLLSAFGKWCGAEKTCS